MLRACHSISLLVHGHPLCFIALVTGSNLCLTQFIRSHGHLLDTTILVIFFLKNLFLVNLTACLNFCRLFSVLVWRYVYKLSLHSWFHHSLECLVILISFEKCLYAVLNMSEMSFVNFSILFSVMRVSDLKKDMLVRMKDSYFFSSSLSVFINDHVYYVYLNFDM